MSAKILDPRVQVVANYPLRFGPWSYQNGSYRAANPEDAQSLHSDCQNTRQQLDELESQLEEVYSQRSRTPAHLKDEIREKEDQIRQLQNAVFSLESKLKQQEEELRLKDIRITQQAETIQIHSEEISKAHNRPSRFESTNVRYPSQLALSKQFQDQGPPAPDFGPPSQPYVAPKPHFKTKWGNVPQQDKNQNTDQSAAWNTETAGTTLHSAARGPRPERRRVADAGSPLQMNRRDKFGSSANLESGNYDIFKTPPRTSQNADGKEYRMTPNTGNSSNYNTIPPAPPQTPARSESVVSRPRSATDGVMMLYGSSTSRQATSARAFAHLFDLTTDFAHTFTNSPSSHADSHLPQTLKQQLLNAATKTTAHKIMSSQTTRYLLVAKVIIGWIQTNVFKEDAFAGLDKGIDDAVLETRKKIFNNTPAPVRFVFLQDIADQFKRLQKCPQYEDFRNSVVHRRAAELWTMIRPLMYTKAEGDWEKMYSLMTEAHRVAEIQLSDIAEYRLFFPKMHDAFHDPSMVRMDSEFDHFSAEELVAQRITVKFSATPQVMARITSPDGNIVTKTLMRAGVLLKA